MAIVQDFPTLRIATLFSTGYKVWIPWIRAILVHYFHRVSSTNDHCTLRERWSQGSTAFRSLPPSSMQPLDRQDTRPSIHSWWSDSNPGLKGPTINLHAVAKPLMKLLYHRQALVFIRKNRGIPLSRTTLEIYSSYFPWDYISSSTKVAILEELNDRAVSEAEAGARAMVHSPAPNHIAQMLGSPDIGARSSSCRLLSNLAKHECAIPTILELRTCERLVSLLCDEDSGITESATYALAEIAHWLDGAHAILDARVLDHVLKLLDSPRAAVRIWTCELVRNLASHKPIVPAVLELKPYEQLVSLLADRDSGVIAKAAYALSQIVGSLDGAQTVFNAMALNHVLVLLESPNLNVRRWICKLVGRLAGHDSAAASAFDHLKRIYYRDVLQLIRRNRASLVLTPTLEIYLSYFPWDYISSSTKDAILIELNDKTVSEADARAMVASPVLTYITELLESPDIGMRSLSCRLLESLARHQCTQLAILELKICERLMSLLSDENSRIVMWAMRALSEIALWLNGALAILNAKVLDHVLELLDSPCLNVCGWTCTLVGRLTSHNSTVPAVVKLNPCVTLVSLLSVEDFRVNEWATYALSHIAYQLDGAQAIVDTRGLDHILELLESPSPSTREWACNLVGRLASHQSTSETVLEATPCLQLVALLHDSSSSVSGRSIYALSQLARWSEGAQTIVDARVLGHIWVLLQSPNSDVRVWTCMLVGMLASHDSIAPAILELKLYAELVTLMRDTYPGVISGAMYALARIARLSEGAEAIVDAKALDYILELLESPNSNTREWTCELVGRLASHPSTAEAVLKSKPCMPLATLLDDKYSGVIEGATYALSQIAHLPEGARDVIYARVQNRILVLLESPSPKIQGWTCILVGRLYSNDSTAQAILHLKPFERLLSLLREPATRTGAIFALCAIGEWPDGIAALADLEINAELEEISQSLNAETQVQVHTILDNLARCKAAHNEIGIAL